MKRFIHFAEAADEAPGASAAQSVACGQEPQPCAPKGRPGALFVYSLKCFHFDMFVLELIYTNIYVYVYYVYMPVDCAFSTSMFFLSFHLLFTCVPIVVLRHYEPSAVPDGFRGGWVLWVLWEA